MREIESQNKGRRPVERQKMRPWLLGLLEQDRTTGLSWIQKDEGTFRVNWKHGARNGWNIERDANVFELWALHTGRHKKGDDPNPKKWKANFRCALNSLDDVIEIKHEGKTKGNDAFRIFKFLEEKKKAQKRQRLKSWDSDDSGVDSPPVRLKTTKYSLRTRKNKKNTVKEETDTSDAVSEILTEQTNDVTFPVPSKESDDAIEQRIKTEFTEQLGITSGVFPNLGCGYVMIRYGESINSPLLAADEKTEAPSHDQVIDMILSDQEDADSDSNDSSDENIPGFQVSPEHIPPSTFNMPTTRNINIVSSSLDFQGNLVIAAEVEVGSAEPSQNTAKFPSSRLPLPVIDINEGSAGQQRPFS